MWIEQGFQVYVSNFNAVACVKFFYVKSDFAESKRSKNVIYSNFRDAELWILVNLWIESCWDLLLAGNSNVVEITKEGFPYSNHLPLNLSNFKVSNLPKFKVQHLWNCYKWHFWTVWIGNRIHLISRKIGVAVKWSNFNKVKP